VAEIAQRGGERSTPVPLRGGGIPTSRYILARREIFEAAKDRTQLPTEGVIGRSHLPSADLEIGVPFAARSARRS